MKLVVAVPKVRESEYFRLDEQATGLFAQHTPHLRTDLNFLRGHETRDAFVTFRDVVEEVKIGEWVFSLPSLQGYVFLRGGQVYDSGLRGRAGSFIASSAWYVPADELAKITWKIAEQGRWMRPERAEGVSS